MKRIVFVDDSISLWAWPSCGGLIVLERVTSVDLKFLEVSAGSLTATYTLRNQDQDQEDRFCRQLLLLGATWYDSRARYGYIWNLRAGFEEDIFDGRNPLPTAVERRYVKVGHAAGGGLWVAEYECLIPGLHTRQPPPDEAALVDLAGSMDERCEMIKALPGAMYYSSPDQYEGLACINAWQSRSIAVADAEESTNAQLQQSNEDV